MICCAPVRFGQVLGCSLAVFTACCFLVHRVIGLCLTSQRLLYCVNGEWGTCLPGPGLARGTRATDACGFREQPGARPLLHARRVVATPRSCSTRGAVTELVGHRSVEPHTPPRRRGGHRPAAPPPTRLAGTCVRPPTTGISSHLFPGNSAAAVTRAALPPPPSLSSPVGSLRVSNAATRDTNRATPADGTSHRHRPRSPRPIQTGPRNTGSSAAATPCDPPPPRRAAPLRSALY